MKQHDDPARIERLRRKMAAVNIDTFMVTVAENRHYLSGYSAEDTQFDETAGALFITGDRLLLATDSRFELQAEREAPSFERFIYKKGLEKELTGILVELGTRRLGFESVRVTVQQLETIRSALSANGLSVEIEATEGIVEGLRLRKDEAEIDAIGRALLLAESAFDRILPEVSPGRTEADLAWALERSLREMGADALSFPTITAAGTNAALPHAVPGNRKIAAGEPLLFDWGARLDGYCSDISRTVFVGEPDETFRKVFTAVYDAQQKAIEAIRPGVSGKAVDKVARDHIDQCGFGDYFGHGLGHGAGLAVHEAPRLSPVRDDILAPGMVFTVEPGIYLPKWGGVRLENMVVLREEGPEVLNRMPVVLPPVG
jgi:Xaa-Pro aminopeptidase